MSRGLTSSALLALTPAWLAYGWLILRAQWFWAHWPDLEFGWIVLLLCGYLFWDACPPPLPLEPRIKWLAVTLFVVGVGLMFTFQIYQVAMGVSPASLAGLALGALAIAGANLDFLWGLQGLRRFLFPFAFMLIAMPMPSLVYGPLIGSLQNAIASVNVEVLNLMGIPAHRIGNLIQLPTCTVGVEEACSVIRSLQ